MKTKKPLTTAAIAALAATVVVLAGCTAIPPHEHHRNESGAGSTKFTRTMNAHGVTLPEKGAAFDYQLGGAYDPPSGVTVVERDRTAKPSGAGYDICYVNGFQTQPSESKSFAAAHPELVVQRNGAPLADPGWPDEFLFDTSTAEKRAALLDIVGSWIDQCAKAGYQAVEIDNLDSYTRSQNALTRADNLAMAAAYAKEAHRVGLAIAQKNTADQAEELRNVGYDFAVTESCYQFSECDSYTSVYAVVLDIEYTDELGEDRFDDACSDERRPPTMILRDHYLVTPDKDDYVYRSCN
ncbi:endo alpha-1,4 polygalactosaminidase [Rothia kristinae]|uniref:endo alpha-1,4 polygalactosaminidase n=1 Tax=Rothia kristinae TaxID=37923 RepID=UPI0011A62445|nr:endo alpha-1,4 polygalactosaminidase [Rothia kristinae]